MKQINKFITILGIAVMLSSCSSIKLTDSWKSENFDETKKAKILVVARATDIDVREAYEQEIVSKLKTNGIDAIEAYKKFPSLKENKNRSEEETSQIVKMFKEEGINAVLLTALKDTKVQKSTQDTTIDDYMSTGDIGKYGVSFTDYYDVNSIEYLSRNLRPVDNPNNPNDFGLTSELISTTYILETVFYNLTLDKKQQLVGVYVIEATDPNSAAQVLKDFTKIISKQFK